MNLGVRAHDIAAGNISMISEKVSEYGFKSVQLALKKSIKDIDFVRGVFSPGLATFFKEELLKNNICVTVLGSYINPVHPDKEQREEELRFFEENLKYAKFMGAHMVGTEPGSVGSVEQTHSEETYQVFLQSFKRLATQAEKLGVLIAIEAVSSCTINNPEKMRRFLDDIDSPNVCVILDCVNMLNVDNYKQQDEIIEKAFSLYKEKIAAIHLKDFKVADGKFIRVIPGEGELNFNLLFKLIKKHKPHIEMLLETYTEEEIPVAKKALEKLFSEA